MFQHKQTNQIKRKQTKQNETNQNSNLTLFILIFKKLSIKYHMIFKNKNKKNNKKTHHQQLAIKSHIKDF